MRANGTQPNRSTFKSLLTAAPTSLLRPARIFITEKYE
jgi:hypothetical protein